MDSEDSDPGPSQRSCPPERMSRLSRRTMAADLVATSSNGAAASLQHQDQPRDPSKPSKLNNEEAASAAAACKPALHNLHRPCPSTKMFIHACWDAWCKHAVDTKVFGCSYTHTKAFTDRAQAYIKVVVQLVACHYLLPCNNITTLKPAFYACHCSLSRGDKHVLAEYLQLSQLHTCWRAYRGVLKLLLRVDQIID